MGEVLFLILAALLLASAILLEAYANRHGKSQIEKWAADRHFEINSTTRLWFSAGGWGLWAGGRTRRYFNVNGINANGAAIRGTVRISGGFGGYVGDVIEVRWYD